MVSTIIYVLGLIAAIWCVLDIFKKDIDIIKKILVTVVVLAFSWLGIILYYFVIKDRI